MTEYSAKEKPQHLRLVPTGLTPFEFAKLHKGRVLSKPRKPQPLPIIKMLRAIQSPLARNPLKANERWILTCLLTKCQKARADNVEVSFKTIAKCTGLSRRTIIRAIAAIGKSNSDPYSQIQLYHSASKRIVNGKVRQEDSRFLLRFRNL